jgi:hypothetical protein
VSCSSETTVPTSKTRRSPLSQRPTISAVPASAS